MPSANKMVSEGVGIVVALTVGLLMAAFLLPVAIDEFNAVDTASWASGTVAIWDIVPLISIVVLFLTMIGWAVSAYRS